MEWLNYHHLLYFWTVAREGSIARASVKLGLAQPTISGQIRALENVLGEKLFSRSGRGLVLTEVGRMVLGYAEDIFSLGRELLDSVKDRPTGRPIQFVVGVADVLPKAVAYRLIEPALHLAEPVQVICREDRPDRLLTELAAHELDVILSDAPISPVVRVRAFNHLLGECGVTFFAVARLAAAHRRGFPKSLHGAPFLLPTEITTVRRSLDEWFESQQIRPRIVGEFDDFSLLRTFGEAGAGVFAAPSVLEPEMRKGGFRPIGRTDDIRERFYAISVERRLKHPAVVAICQSAREELFG
jgi:LysR family transcriptional activator of nhaA